MINTGTYSVIPDKMPKLQIKDRVPRSWTLWGNRLMSFTLLFEELTHLQVYLLDRGRNQAAIPVNYDVNLFKRCSRTSVGQTFQSPGRLSLRELTSTWGLLHTTRTK